MSYGKNFLNKKIGIKPMIQMFHVHKTYQKDIHALVDVSINVRAGEFFIINGPSGAGKTTLLKVLMGIEPFDKGEIIVNGRNLNRLRKSKLPYLRREIGVVFQDFKLLDRLTVYDNIALVLKVIGMREKEIKRKVRYIAWQVGLYDKLFLTPPKLSGGEKQRAAIARALVNEPRLVLADEPTGNLDPIMASDIMQLLSEINASGTTILMATHNPELMAQYGERGIHLDKGRVTGEFISKSLI